MSRQYDTVHLVVVTDTRDRLHRRLKAAAAAVSLGILQITRRKRRRRPATISSDGGRVHNPICRSSATMGRRRRRRRRQRFQRSTLLHKAHCRPRRTGRRSRADSARLRDVNGRDRESFTGDRPQEATRAGRGRCPEGREPLPARTDPVLARFSTAAGN